MFAGLGLAVQPTLLPAAIFNVANGDVPGLISAIQAANATVVSDTIVLANGGDYPLSAYIPTANPLDRTGLPRITSNIVIEGHGSVIRRADSIAFPVPEFRFFRLSSAGTLTLRDTTLRKGSLGPANGDYSDANGSAIRNDGGSVTVENCRFENGYNNHMCAGLLTTGPTIVTDSTFANNLVPDFGTGAIQASNCPTVLIQRCHFYYNRGDDVIQLTNVPAAEIDRCSIVKYYGSNGAAGIRAIASTLRVSNCTITQGNKSGVVVGNQSTVTLSHCTITEYGAINFPGSAVHVATNGVLLMSNSILALGYQGNFSNIDCANYGTIQLNVGNLIQDGSCNPDFIGNPKLGDLGFYGGSTMVFPLIDGSPALNNANDALSETVDQRGVARPLGPHADIGAYEGVIRDPKKNQPIRVDLLTQSTPYFIICDPDPPGGPIEFTVLGSREVPVRAIVANSLTLGNAPPGGALVRGIRDVNRDGLDDLQVSFDLAQVYRGAFDCAAVTLLELQGDTLNGEQLAGYINVQATGQ